MMGRDATRAAFGTRRMLYCMIHVINLRDIATKAVHDLYVSSPPQPMP